MKYIDHHAHMVSRTTDDYQKMSLSGCVAVTEPAFWAGWDRSHADGFEDYFRQLTEYETKRANAFGIEHRGLEIEVEVADAAGRQLDLAVAERALVDDVAQPRASGSGLRQRMEHRHGAAGGCAGRHGHRRLASTKPDGGKRESI